MNMVKWIAEAVAYALMGGLVVLMNYRRPCTRIAAYSLLALTLSSSATFFVLYGPDWFQFRVLREVLFITPVATVFAYLYLAGDGLRCYRTAIAICLVDIIICTAIFMSGGSDDTLRSVFGWATNLVFIGLCVCIAIPGVRDAYADWIADIERMRRLDSSAPDLDLAIRMLDRSDRK